MPANVSAPIVLDPGDLTATPHKFGLFSALNRGTGPRHWATGVTVNDLCAQGVPASEAVICAPGYTDIDWDAITADSGIGIDIEARELVLPIGCKMLGMEDTKVKARSLFTRIEQSGWERVLADVAYTDGTGAGGADVTNVVTGMAALLDAWYALNGTQAIVHASPGVATWLSAAGLVNNRTSHAELDTGERLVIGGGYKFVTGHPNVLFASADLVGYEAPMNEFEVANTATNDYTFVINKTILVGSQCPMIYVDLADTGLTG